MWKTLLSNRRLKQILLLVLGGFVVIIVVLTFLFYRYTIHSHEQSELNKLQGIANAMALHIDGPVHERLMARHQYRDDIIDNATDPDYQHIHHMLRQHYDANMLRSPVYTIVKSKDGKFYEFGVTSADRPYFRHPYKSYPQNVFNMYQQGGTISAYEDEFGMWLSAFAPVKNNAGKNVALVMVDEQLSSFMGVARKQLLITTTWSILIFGSMYFLLVYILGKILHRENQDKLDLEQKHLEILSIKKQLESAFEKLQESDTTRKEMIANLSHDFRTPLSSVIGYAELIKDNAAIPDAKRSEYVKIIHAEASRLVEMVNDLFELSILDSGNSILHLEPFNLLDLVYDITTKYQAPLSAKAVDLNYYLDPTLPLAKGDVKYIGRVFQNLLDNAIKYVPQTGYIAITVAVKENLLTVKVCNNGTPIPEELREKIFERYHKGNDSGGGTGLGLAIAKKICILHNTDISLIVNGDINSFYFSIPRYLD